MNTEEIASKCVDEILKKKNLSGNKLFAAVTGDSGSGKSFYSVLIRDILEERGIEYTYLNADDFLIARMDREPMKNIIYQTGPFKGKSEWEILENMFRLDEFRRVIDELKTTGMTRYKPYLRDTGTIAEDVVKVWSEKLVIFDTSMLLEKMDYVIMVDVDMDKIIERKVLRDADIRTPKQIEEMHRKVQGYYWQRMKPKEPNIVINNNDFENPEIIVN